MFCAALLLGLCLPARAAPLVADLSEHLVAITTGFSGAKVLLFGAVEDRGDVVVVVRGPTGRQTLHRKSRVAGVWMNTARFTFANVPVFYAVASSRPLDDVAEVNTLSRHELGVENLRLEARTLASPNVVEEWRQGLVRNKQAEGLFVDQPGQVTFIGDRLFRASIYLPPNVPVGFYKADVFLLREGRVVSAQTTPLSVSKVGLEADLFAFAHEYAALYGLIAVCFAFLAGWLAYVAFRRR
jgi:uncharacterized protein (TIGR02186 family)